MATLYSELFDLATFHYSSYEHDILYAASVNTCPSGVTYYTTSALTTSAGITAQAYTSTYITGSYSSIVKSSVVYYVATSDCIASNYDIYMTGFLKNAIPEFKNCLQDLSDRNDVTMTFNITLTDSEKDILTCLLVAQILKKEVFDIRQIRAMIQNGSDANRYSEANLLKEKLELQRDLIELAGKKKTDYELENEDWSTFYGN